MDSPELMPNGHRMGKMHMNGSEVFKFATRVIGESITQALDIAGLSVKDLSLIVPHQANARIIQAAARSMKIDESLFVTNVDRYGNTSAASIPIALCEAIQQGRVKENDYLAFVGFGGGLTWASMVVKWGAPKPEDRTLNRFNRPRREFSYVFARWRARLARLSRQINDAVRRIRPQQGRMQRLRQRFDRETLE